MNKLEICENIFGWNYPEIDEVNATQNGLAIHKYRRKTMKRKA